MDDGRSAREGRARFDRFMGGSYRLDAVLAMQLVETIGLVEEPEVVAERIRIVFLNEMDHLVANGSAFQLVQHGHPSFQSGTVEPSTKVDTNLTFLTEGAR